MIKTSSRVDPSMKECSNNTVAITQNVREPDLSTRARNLCIVLDAHAQAHHSDNNGALFDL